MLRWTSVLLVLMTVGASAQAPSAAGPVDASTDAVEPTDAVEGAANVSAGTEPAPVDGGATSAIASEAIASEASAAASGDATATELGASAIESSGGAAATTTPRGDSAVELTRPVAPPPPPVGFDDERAAPPTEEPRPRSPLRERFVIFSPGWMPIVTLGYRAQIVRYTGGSVSRSDTSHGLTSGVLAPVLATGDSSSRVRLALGVGMGLDVAWRSEGPGAEVDAVVTAGDDPVYMSPAYVERALLLYGQMGALAQITLGRSQLMTSLVWLPTRRFVHVREDHVGFSIGSAPSDYSSRAFKRFRFNVGLARAGFLVSAFLGGGSVAARGSAGEIEAGIQLGIAR